ncbi:Hypothetical protein CAP_3904 [Chondromyces apiculatus DSM 436]|uniref:Uncharacterized protein n=1 Tax=Chondromyces apiculatus DSM 436 TaxID=1192034 RepID=A0A017T6I2_9BACT|nr:Hypothetical protein CAP_3904 [Chondromyces apiculatus DSM 436]
MNRSISDLSALGRLPALAHHPTCGRHDHHLLRPFGLALCLGCTSMYPGIAAALGGLLLAAPDQGFRSVITLGVVSLLCAGPTFAQPFVQKRWFKVPARFTLGVGIGLLLGAVWCAPFSVLGWAARVVMVAAAIGLAATALTLRQRHAKDPCLQCPWGSYPLCAYNLPAIQRMRDARGPDPLLDGLIAELSPLAPYPPRFGAAPPVRRPGQVAFATVPLAPPQAPPTASPPPPATPPG